MTVTSVLPRSEPAPINPAYAAPLAQSLSELGLEPIGILGRELLLHVLTDEKVRTLGEQAFVNKVLTVIEALPELWESIDSITFA